MQFNTLSAILHGQWLIDRGFVEDHLPIIFGIVSGKANGGELFRGSAEYEKPFVYNNGKRYEAYINVYRQGVGMVPVLNADEWPDNSTGVIPLIGPVLKYNGDCGEPGMIQRMSWANDFANSGKIVKLVSWLDSPGGQADGTPQYADFIKTIDKPKTAFVDGGAYSAAAWIASAHDEIMLANEYTGFGSIGAYCTWVDYSGYYKKMGFKVKDIFSKLSPEKCDAYRKAQNGDFSGYQASSDECAGLFIEQFALNRTGKLKSEIWNKGNIFNTKQSLDMGLIDGVANFATAAKYIGKTSITKPHSNAHKQQSDMKFTYLTSLAGLKTVTDEQLDMANGELTTAEITSLTLVRESFIQEAADISKDLTKTKGDLATQTEANATATSGLVTANATITTQAATIAALEAKVEAFGKNAGGQHTDNKGDDTPPEGPQSDAEILDNLAHNKTADKVLGK